MRVTILSTADFDNPIWTNKQYIACGLAEQSPVTFINSLGLRQPTLNRTDLYRILRRLTKKGSMSAHAARKIPDALRIVSPRVLPWHGNRIAQIVNRLLLKRIISRIPKEERDVLWSFSPVTYGIEKYFRVVVYHSVDLLHTFPGIPSEVVLASERRIIGNAHQVICSSGGLKMHLEEQGASDVLQWDNVADTALYEEYCTQNRANRAIFAGNLTPTKVDFELLLDIADRGTEVALAGPIAYDGTKIHTKLQTLLHHPNVAYLGLLSPRELAKEVGKSKVGLIPYALNGHTSGIFPMKVYEYLAAGAEVVSTMLPSVVASGTDLVYAERDGFSQAVEKAIADYTEDAALDRTSMARPFSWQGRIRDAQQLLVDLEQRIETS